MQTHAKHRVEHWAQNAQNISALNLIAEEPLSIRVQGHSYAVVMRTPGEERAHVAGLCLTEGIVDTPEDLVSIAFCDGHDTNVVAVTLTSARREMMDDILNRRAFISQTRCGICGQDIIRDLRSFVSPMSGGPRIPLEAAMRCFDALSEQQALRRETVASHAAAVFDSNLTLLAAGEDVGRHNALDKVIGKLFLDRRLSQACVLVLSSRVSYELVQKAARARIPIVLAVSRPTTLAVEMTAQLNMTLAGLARDGGLFVFCGGQRLQA